MSRTFNSIREYQAEGFRLHPGVPVEDWEFVCPKCGVVHTMRDWKEKGYENNRVARICLDCGYENVGKYPILVKDAPSGSTDSVFEFARAKKDAVANRPKGGLGLF